MLLPLDARRLPPSLPACLPAGKIYEPLLQNFDIRLYEHLTGLGIEPQLFALRWVRVCFGREFRLSDVLLLWDGIFAYSEGQDGRLTTSQGWHAGQADTETGGIELPLIPYVCVAMLMFMRTSLIDHDEITCMRRLQVFPEMADNRLLLDIARRLRDGAGVPTYSAATRSQTSPAKALAPTDDTVAASGTARQLHQPHAMREGHNSPPSTATPRGETNSALAAVHATRQTSGLVKAPVKGSNVVASRTAGVHRPRDTGRVPGAGPAPAAVAPIPMRQSTALAAHTSTSRSELLQVELTRRRAAMAAAGRKLDGVLTRLQSNKAPSGAAARAELAVLQEVREQLRVVDDVHAAGHDTDDDIPVE